MSELSELPSEECSSSESVFVGYRQELVRNRKTKYNVNGRDIVIFYLNGNFHAMDQRCYHAGGPLEKGDIEDISGRWCIICPYHKQKITLDTGEGLHFSIDPKDLKKPPKLCSKGAVQRIHQVQVKEDKVFVTLSSTKQYIPSDFYYSKKIEKD
ncbi:unnamed protein product [Porites lobata]|uniref:Rieske domain-containing protein n=1 Tax=Porites lobata TaxID=104759 RepID=A0ABN8NRY5_9CNID|nr:unnamed protein product [Porites lobata]